MNNFKFENGSTVYPKNKHGIAIIASGFTVLISKRMTQDQVHYNGSPRGINMVSADGKGWYIESRLIQLNCESE